MDRLEKENDHRKHEMDDLIEEMAHIQGHHNAQQRIKHYENLRRELMECKLVRLEIVFIILEIERSFGSKCAIEAKVVSCGS